MGCKKCDKITFIGNTQFYRGLGLLINKLAFIPENDFEPLNMVFVHCTLVITTMLLKK